MRSVRSRFVSPSCSSSPSAARPKASSLSSSVARPATSRPAGVISASVVRRSASCGTRRGRATLLEAGEQAVGERAGGGRLVLGRAALDGDRPQLAHALDRLVGRHASDGGRRADSRRPPAGVNSG
jgi:hypothetical protein